MELWRDIPGYEGLYQVSNEGRVKSLGNNKSKKEKILKTHINSIGYAYINLQGLKCFKIHRLVALAFIPNPNNYEVVHHIDHNPKNNMVENLKWISKEEHQKLHCLNSKTVFQYTLDGELVAVWESGNKAANELGFSSGVISECCHGKRHTYKGSIWSFKPLSQ